MSFDPIRTKYVAVEVPASAQETAEALERAHKLRPTQKDLLSLDLTYSGLGSDDSIKSTLSQYHHLDDLNTRARFIQDELYEDHIGRFIKTCQITIPDWGAKTIRTVANRFLREERQYELEQFLAQIVVNGWDKALKTYRRREFGGVFGNILAMMYSASEIAILMLVLSRCSSRFEVTMVSLVAFAYAALINSILTRHAKTELLLKAIKGAIENLRVATKDATFDWAERNESTDKEELASLRAGFLDGITVIKASVIQAISVVELVHSIF